MPKLINASDRIFVAGASGMVGSAVCRSLIRHGYGKSSCNGELQRPSRKELNLLDATAVDKWFESHKPTVVILAAAKVGGIYANNKYPAQFLLENIKIQSNVIESAWKNGVRRLLFLGSSCIYPKDCPQPISEEYLLSGDLESTNQWYAIAKIAGLKLCEALRVQYGFDAITLMPTNLYGPGDNYHPENSHVLPALIRRIYSAKETGAKSVTCWGTGNPRREFLFVDDLAEACIYVLENWDPMLPKSPTNQSGGLLTYLNVGTGQDITIRELAETVASTLHYEGSICWDHTKPDGTFRKQLNVNRINSLGWTASTTLHQGLKNTITDFMETSI